MSSAVGMYFSPYKLITCSPVISSNPSCMYAPSSPIVLIPCSGENILIKLNPAFFKANLLLIPVLVIAASFVSMAIRSIFQFGSFFKTISIPNCKGIHLRFKVAFY